MLNFCSYNSIQIAVISEIGKLYSRFHPHGILTDNLNENTVRSDLRGFLSNRLLKFALFCFGFSIQNSFDGNGNYPQLNYKQINKNQ